MLVGGQSVVLFGLRRRRSVGLREIAGLLPDVAAAVSSARRCPVRVRLADDGAPVLEVPHPDPAPLRLPGGAWPAGRAVRCSVGATGLAARDLRVDLAVDPHLLIVAQTGGGKSSLLQLAALSLAWSASPADLRLLLIDHKRESCCLWRTCRTSIRFPGARLSLPARAGVGGCGDRPAHCAGRDRAAGGGGDR